MALIPKQDHLKELLDHELVLQEFRPYIGMSGLNGPCMRRTWYVFHWSSDRYVPKRVDRIFARGDIEEARVIADLRAVGMEVDFCLDDQIELVDETGHIKGHPDGLVSKVLTAPKTPHLLEVKTMKNDLFKKYLKEGLEKAYPTYWGQVHTYMGKWNLTRCLFIATNKDTEERHYERIKYDKQVHDDCMHIGMEILMSEKPPRKIGDRTWFECKFCDCKPICHMGEPIKRTCRSCKHVLIEMGGKWSCGLHMIDGLTEQEQMASCGQYQLDEVFL